MSKKCEVGFAAQGDTCVCAPGYEPDGEDCVHCESGFFKASAGNTNCLSCGVGTSNANHTACTCNSESMTQQTDGSCACNTANYYYEENGVCEYCNESIVIPQYATFAHNTAQYATELIAELGPYHCPYDVYVKGHIDDTFLITDEDFPRILIVRKRNMNKLKGK